MPATSLRRIAAAALVAAGLAAVAAPVASADSISVGTRVDVPYPYPAAALLPGNVVDESKGPVMIHVQNTIRCLKGTVHRSGYPKTCQWSSGLWSNDATLSDHQGAGDLYAAGVDGRPQGDTFHAGVLSPGGTAVDNWNIVVRGDDLPELTEMFHLSIAASRGGSLTRDFWILDDDRH
jgi:hypothetical protein